MAFECDCDLGTHAFLQWEEMLSGENQKGGA